MVETDAYAVIKNVTFNENQATDDGGAIAVRRRSHLNINGSALWLNRAGSNGGSIFIHYSQADIVSSSFENETAVAGYGGCICIDNIANVSIHTCNFTQCRASSGGSIAVKTESMLFAMHVTITGSLSTLNGGGVFVTEGSKVEADNLTLHSSTSGSSGGGIYLSELSELNMNNYIIAKCHSVESGAALSSKSSKLKLNRGIVKENSADQDGGGLYVEQCHSTFNLITMADNEASGSGGGLCAKASDVALYNSEDKGNSAAVLGDFIFTVKSNLRTYFLTWGDKTDIVQTNSSSIRTLSQ